MRLWKAEKLKFIAMGALVCAMLILSGMAYRAMACRLKIIVSSPIELRNPLAEFPLKVQNWIGRDVPIPETVQQVAGNDDFFNRFYKNNSNSQWADVYVAYSARPRTMQGHRPDYCYVGAGWVHDGTEKSVFLSESGRDVPCLIHFFHMPSPQSRQRIVLNFYIVNGTATSDESVFSGLSWRTPNIAGNPARYVAQIQVSSTMEDNVRDVARDLTDIIFSFFPDGRGNFSTLPPFESEKDIQR